MWLSQLRAEHIRGLRLRGCGPSFDHRPVASESDRPDDDEMMDKLKAIVLLVVKSRRPLILPAFLNSAKNLFAFNHHARS
jgi:hypothetical protein